MGSLYYINAVCKIPDLNPPNGDFYTTFYWSGDVKNLNEKGIWRDDGCNRSWFYDLDEAKEAIKILKERYPNANLHIISQKSEVVEL